MWPSSSSSRRRVRGFTLLEAMISLLLLVIVLIVAMTMLFQMRAFAERQQYFMLPRQAARRATDYLSYYFAGASDVNYVDSTHPSPNALIMYYNLNGAVTQASYNNLGCPDSTGATTCKEPGNDARDIPANPPVIPMLIKSTKFGDIGTDIITMVSPFSPGRYQVWAPFPTPLGSGMDLFFNFRVGCGVGLDDVANLAAFTAATGFDAVTGSALLMLVDRNGSWSYVRIPSGGLGASKCSDVTAGSFKNIHVTADAASPAPPNGVASFTDPVYLVTGLQVISFRVLTDSVDGVPKLQQKLGLFDPATDNPGTAFTNVMENVEDLQIAYVYSQDAAAGADGLVWNTASQKISSAALTGVPAVPGCPQATCDNGVPFQAGPNFGATPPALDISNVIGVRFSITGRSPLLPIGARQLTNVDAKDDLVVADPSTTPNQHFRPRSEDHDVTMDTTRPLYDQYDHYRATATLMLRNRIPKG